MNYTERDSLITQQAARIDQLEGMVEMQADALKHANRSPYPFGHLELFDNAINTTAETVQAYRDKLTEPLRREVAMLHSILNKFEYNEFGVKRFASEDEVSEAINNTQATAQAYEQEVEARGAVKALEEFLKRSGFESTTASTMLDELRATSKKAG